MGPSEFVAADYFRIQTDQQKRRIPMSTLRIIGIDLAVTAAHRAIVLDGASNLFVSGVISFFANPAEMNGLLEIARKGASPDTRIIVILEATQMSWFTVGTYLARHGAEVYRVNGGQTADQRKVYNRHAKSDRIDARVLTHLYFTARHRLTCLQLPEPNVMELQRACRELVRLSQQISATKNRLKAVDSFAWLGLNEVFEPYDLPARWVREHWYDPWQVQLAGLDGLKQTWQSAYPDSDENTEWLPALIDKANQVTDFYGLPSPINYQLLQDFLIREQSRLDEMETQKHALQLRTIHPLYRQLHPSRNLESIAGIAQDSAAVYIAFVGDIKRFPSLNKFLGWSGMTPGGNQSGDHETVGLPLTQAGPDLIKRTAFVDAQVARLYDPQIAAIYYDQMVKKGKHYLQAICACASHLLIRVYVVMREDRPLELRDVDGTPLSKNQARDICIQRYTVPDEIRKRNNHRVRVQRAEQRIEQRTQRREANQKSKG
jgi:transposase